MGNLGFWLMLGLRGGNIYANDNRGSGNEKEITTRIYGGRGGRV